MISAELLDIADRLTDLHTRFQEECFPDIRKLMGVAADVQKAWSGSNIGYHANVYYAGLQPRPPGAQFSSEWGMEDHWPVRGTVGDWHEFSPDDVVAEIYRRVGNPDLTNIRAESSRIAAIVLRLKSDITSCLSIAISERQDIFLTRLRDKTEESTLHNPSEVLEAILPSGSFMSRDMLALSQGLRAAPHQQVVADVTALNLPSKSAMELSQIARQAGSHLSRLERKMLRANLVGTNVVIGHGRSPAWRDLKDFVKERLGLPHDEFNRVPIAGVTNVARLGQMLNGAAVALIVMTAEDETNDGKTQARMNVVHEVGLFQGRLGFDKAVIILEEGCEEFSNIQGLGQIRFPKSNISACFEQIREVLEREEMLAV